MPWLYIQNCGVEVIFGSKFYYSELVSTRSPAPQIQLADFVNFCIIIIIIIFITLGTPFPREPKN